ncbi:alpha/beta hydrolase [Paraburkholderia sp. D15]|uniref:alpha/beta fold hydrolase n=1 Tax=Paraburkholderia sp. D15 TaxID=2880218 RepID=UPI00247AC912|nr:alpha/beta hydrolase [Paraburkholderia sp. D15]WGS54373.1 alpha/beta hydrolase [Paraburkholderia sp. D15]WKF60072.1 putative carboxylesterase nap [Paraburkholderia busanensis]
MKPIFRSKRAAAEVLDVYRRTLAYWPAPCRHLTLPTREGHTFVLASGPEHAPAVLLLHGSQTNSASWMRYVSDWAQRFRVYAIDVIGEAGLSAPSRPPLASDAYALWLDDVMQALQLDRAAMVGISLGAWMALDFAIRKPARVERLALLCPSGIGRQKPFLLKIAPLLLLGAWGRRRIRDIVLGPMPDDLQPADRAMLDLMETIDRGFRPRLGTIPVFTDAQLRTLAVPLLTMLGGRDALLDSTESLARLRRLVPHADVRYFAEQPHFIRGQGDAIAGFLAAREEALHRAI